MTATAYGNIDQHRVELAFAERAFCHAAPPVWNSLPQSITSDIFRFTSFQRLLQTEYFNRAYRKWHVFSRTLAIFHNCERLNVRY